MISQAAHRWLIRASLGLLAVGMVLALAGLASRSPTIGGVGLVLLIGGTAAFAASLAERVACRMLGRETAFDPSHAILAPPREGCHACGYAMTGVRGVFCPECGAVRATPGH